MDRVTIEVVGDDRTEKVEVTAGTRVEEVFRSTAVLDGADENPIVAGRMNGELKSLLYRLPIGCRLDPVRLHTPAGRRIYRRSLSFVLSMASQRVEGFQRLVIGHSLGDGYFFRIDGIDGAIPAAMLDELRRLIREIIEADFPIFRRVAAYSDVLDFFRRRGLDDTAGLLSHRNENTVPIYECDGFIDLSHGPLVPRTGMLASYEVIAYEDGFVLRFLDEGDPSQPFRGSPVLFSIYREYKRWGRILEVDTVSRLNARVEDGTIEDFILVTEALQERRVSEIADRIGRKDEARIVLIAGPSSSGKTTFAKKLSIQLRVLGFRPIAISLDDYFVPRDRTPRDADGNYDFESIDAIDLELFNEHLNRLLAGDEVQLPRFDFKTGTRASTGKVLHLPDAGLIITEGIHGLNPRLTGDVPGERTFRVYVSALTQLNLDGRNRIPTTDNRLVRRMVRDFRFRGHTAGDTLAMWPLVRRGEERNIFPFQDSADEAFNSALDYELGVLKSYAEPLLRSVKPNDFGYGEALRLLSFLQHFVPIDARYVPERSIVREFVGGSRFKY